MALTISFKTAGIIEIEIGLVREEAVPVIGLRFRIPGPVGFLGIGENDARIAVLLIGVAPNVEVPLHGTGWSLAGPLKPRVLIRRVIDDELNQHLQIALVRGVQERLEIVHRSVAGMDVVVVRNVVTVIAQGRWKERQQPEAGDAEILEIIELLRESLKVADPVVIAVEERLYVGFINDGVFIPERVLRACLELHRLIALQKIQKLLAGG